MSSPGDVNGSFSSDSFESSVNDITLGSVVSSIDESILSNGENSVKLLEEAKNIISCLKEDNGLLKKDCDDLRKTREEDLERKDKYIIQLKEEINKLRNELQEKPIVSFDAELIRKESEKKLDMEKVRFGSQIAALTQQLTNLRYENENIQHLKENSEKELVNLRVTLERNQAMMNEQMADPRLSTTTSKIETLTNEVSDYRNQVELLKLEKQYLRREADTFKNEASLKTEELKNKSTKIQRLKHQNALLEQSIADTKSNTTLEMEENYQTQLTRLRNQHHEDLDRLKHHYEQFKQSEQRLLSDSNATLSKKIESQRTKIQRFENTTETLREEMTKLRDTINQQNFQIRTKTAEIDRRNMMNEEKSRLLKESEMKREELHEMLTLVKSEYQKLELRAHKETYELKTLLNTEREKVNVYNTLESEWDRSILDAAAARDNNGLENPCNTLIDPTAPVIPTRLQKRIEQAMELAQKLAVTRASLQEVEEKNEQLQSELAVTKERLEVADEKIAQVSQPHNYLVDMLHKKSSEVDELEREIQILKETENTLQTDNNEMRQDIQRLLDAQEERDRMFDALQQEIQNHKKSIEDYKLNEVKLETEKQELITSLEETTENLRNLELFQKEKEEQEEEEEKRKNDEDLEVEEKEPTLTDSTIKTNKNTKTNNHSSNGHVISMPSQQNGGGVTMSIGSGAGEIIIDHQDRMVYPVDEPSAGVMSQFTVPNAVPRMDQPIMSSWNSNQPPQQPHNSIPVPSDPFQVRADEINRNRPIKNPNRKKLFEKLKALQAQKDAEGGSI